MEVKTLLFDLDDTLYPASSGFSDHRNSMLGRFMVESLGFDNEREALALRNEYFIKYHSSMKALTVAHAEGRLPRPFVQQEMAQFWAENCDFATYAPPNPALTRQLTSLRDDAGLTLAIFTNAPRAFCLRCLEEMDLRQVFPEHRIFAVEDVLPACKPEAAAFDHVLGALKADRSTTVMFEDSMKNIRVCHGMGMGTVLLHDVHQNSSAATAPESEAQLLGDVPMPEDPTVDVVLRRIEELERRIPELSRGQMRKKS